MRRNISIRFHRIGHPNRLLEIIDEETSRMQRHHAGIQGFKVTVDVPHVRRRHGNQVSAQVIVDLSRDHLVISKEVEGRTEFDNAAMALRRAFDAAENAVDHAHSNREVVRSEAAIHSNHVSGTWMNESSMTYH